LGDAGAELSTMYEDILEIHNNASTILQQLVTSGNQCEYRHLKSIQILAFNANFVSNCNFLCQKNEAEESTIL
jgi:hypothetical protein